MKTWLHLFSLFLLIVSLWLVKITIWPVLVLIATILFSMFNENSLKSLFKRVIPIILLMSFFQFVFSSFYRDALILWVRKGEYSPQIIHYFVGSISRFSVPLILFSKIEQFTHIRMNDVLQLTQIFKYFGLSNKKLNLLIITIVRIIPSQQITIQSLEFTHRIFDSSIKERSSLLMRVKKMAILVKAGIALSIRDSIKIGDTLALRHSKLKHDEMIQFDFNALIFWLLIGIGIYFLSFPLFGLWTILSAWGAILFLMRWSKE